MNENKLFSEFPNKKYLYFLLLLIPNNIFAQAGYMNEIAEDSGYRSGDNSILGYIGFACIVILIIIFTPLMISNKVDNLKFEKKHKSRRDILTEEAKNILFNAIDKTLMKARQNKAWSNWFIDGYIDGVGKYIIHCSIKERLENNWEDPAERHISMVREELIGGDRSISLSLYKEGYKEGLRRRELKGDID